MSLYHLVSQDYLPSPTIPSTWYLFIAPCSRFPETRYPKIINKTTGSYSDICFAAVLWVWVRFPKSLMNMMIPLTQASKNKICHSADRFSHCSLWDWHTVINEVFALLFQRHLLKNLDNLVPMFFTNHTFPNSNLLSNKKKVENNEISHYLSSTNTARK